MNNGASTCPAHGVDCGWLVFLFTVTMILNAFRANRVEMPPEDGEQQPIAEWNRNSRVIVAPFVFHRESQHLFSPMYPTNWLNFSPQRRPVPLRRAECRAPAGLQRVNGLGKYGTDDLFGALISNVRRIIVPFSLAAAVESHCCMHDRLRY